jgi:hypothetical protein
MTTLAIQFFKKIEERPFCQYLFQMRNLAIGVSIRSPRVGGCSAVMDAR